MTIDRSLHQSILDCVRKYSELDLLLLFGSRARGEAGQHSDWDFGYIAARNFDSADRAFRFDSFPHFCQ